MLGEVNRNKNRIHKVLQDANIKISSVLSDVFGETGKSILNQIIGNQCITEEFIYSLYEGRGKSKLNLPQWKCMKRLMVKSEGIM